MTRLTDKRLDGCHDTVKAHTAPGRSPQEDEVDVILDNPGYSPAASTSRCLLPDRTQIQATVALPCKVLAAPAADSSYLCLGRIRQILIGDGLDRNSKAYSQLAPSLTEEDMRTLLAKHYRVTPDSIL